VLAFEHSNAFFFFPRPKFDAKKNHFLFVAHFWVAKMGNTGNKSGKKSVKNPEKMYTMLRVMGKGSFGKVNAIERKDTKQLYALKAMSKKEILDKGETVVQLVLQERRLLSELNHPFLVNLHYAFQNDTDLLLVMDICLGGDLLYWRQTKGPFRQHHVKFYAVCLYYALEYIHSKNVTHRDIKVCYKTKKKIEERRRRKLTFFFAFAL
jgi:serine/threonine protein kinase